jgi:hypothetical protein
VPDSFTHRWLRNGAAIGGAIAATYLLVTADASTVITAEVTAVNVDGSTPALSGPTEAIEPLPPVNTVPPVVSGQPLVNSLLTVDPGTWTDPLPFEYQWYSGIAGGGSADPIIDAEDAELLVTPELLGHTIGCVVTSGLVGAVSNWVGPVTFPPLTPAQEYALFLSRYSYPRPGARFGG